MNGVDHRCVYTNWIAHSHIKVQAKTKLLAFSAQQNGADPRTNQLDQFSTQQNGGNGFGFLIPRELSS